MPRTVRLSKNEAIQHLLDGDDIGYSSQELKAMDNKKLTDLYNQLVEPVGDQDYLIEGSSVTAKLAAKYGAVAKGDMDQNYVVLYRKKDTDPWSTDVHTYFPKEKAMHVKESYKSKGFQEVKVAFALLEDERYT